MRPLLGSFVVPAVGLLAWAQTFLRPVPAARIVDISPSGGSFSEPFIAVNPNNPAQVVAVYQVGALAAYSNNSGRSFAAAQAAPASDYRVFGDVSVAFDNQGNAFLCYLAFDHLGTAQYWAHGAGRNGIYVRRSANGGKSWEKGCSSNQGVSYGPGT